MNGRLDTLQAAILIEKLAIFSEEINLREDVAGRYFDGLYDIQELILPNMPRGMRSIFAQFTLRVPADRRDEIVAHLRANGVPTAVYYPRPLHQQTAYRAFPVSVSGLANSERLSQEVLSLPMHPYLPPAQQDQVISSLRQAMGV